MDLTTDTIKVLANIMSQENLTDMEIRQGNVKIKLERKPSPTQETLSLSPKMEGKEKIAIPEISVAKMPSQNLTEIKSPMVGIFYESNEAGGDPFVSVGEKFKLGETLCIIEAMKLMNEITAEKSGKLIERCVKNGDVVEYGQTLYRIQEMD